MLKKLGTGHEKKDLYNVLLAVGILMGFIFLVSIAIYLIKDNFGLSCSCKVSLPLIIAALTSLGVLVGIMTYYFLSQSFSKEKEQLQADVRLTLDFLGQEEKRIVSALIECGGEVAQNELSRLTKMSPVKLHRRLLSLETKNILKKEKKGMTNKVGLNESFHKIFVR